MQAAMLCSPQRGRDDFLAFSYFLDIIAMTARLCHFRRAPARRGTGEITDLLNIIYVHTPPFDD